MSTKKALCTFITLIAGLVTITNLADFTALAQQETDRVSMSSIDLPIFLAIIVAAGVIAGLAFIVIAAAESARRRR